MDKNILVQLRDWLISLGLDKYTSSAINAFAILLIIILLAYLADIIAKKLLRSVILTMVRRTKTTWDDILLEKKVFSRLAHLAPALVVYYTIDYSLDAFPTLKNIIHTGVYIYMLVIGLLVLDSLISGLHDIYMTLPISKNRPIKGYVQVFKIIVYFLGIIFVLSILLNKSVLTFFAGLGAMAAVLILIFKDSILGLVAGVQLSANDMVRLGDWISMPNHNADGNVIDISLNTVKVQNWDKTISTIPTYALVSESFNNWRGMEESGGRRIKRSINIDMKSVRFCNDEMIARFKKIKYLKEYIEKKQQELSEYNRKQEIDESVLVNGRRMTNLGTFRKYLEEYLKHHPKIHNDMTFLIRHLTPTEKGIPLEVYVFSNDQAWANYEAIQADIFDHIIAVIPEFGLRVFQNPTGEDFARLAGK
ncbi:MAG TPA: mechanosensitive ion channel domain-containing protein [Bacteroidales bacterium]|nr:mechanosensitive ion channel domain-containing protein [Bacteroidales bacterium]